MSLYSLVYVSYATHPMTDDELRDLLDVSRRNNARLNITGMLLYRDGFFIQALEGERQAVEDLYERIKQDERHNNVLRVYAHEVTARSFGAWSMGFNRVADADLGEGYTDILQSGSDLETFVTQPSLAVSLLASFKNRTYF